MADQAPNPANGYPTALEIFSSLVEIALQEEKLEMLKNRHRTRLSRTGVGIHKQFETLAERLLKLETR